MLHGQPAAIKYATLKLESANISAVMTAVADKWKAIDPIHPLEYEFYEETLANTNKGIFDLVTVVGFLAFVAILIACLGLLGIAIYTTERRTKEIGIRKVLGAGVWQINVMLLKEFIMMLGLAAFIAAPLAFLFNTYWLNIMVVRDDLKFGTIVFGAVIILALRLLTIVPQTLRIAKSRPVKSRKMEG